MPKIYIDKKKKKLKPGQPAQGEERFSVSGEEVTKEEFATIQGKGGVVTPKVEEIRKKQAVPKLQKEQAEVTRLQEERATTEEEVAPVEEEVPVQEPTQETPKQEQEYYTDPETGEVTPLYSGGVTPVTASDIVDVATMFSGLGLAKGAAKVVGKKAIQKGGLIGTNTAKVGMLNTIKNKLFGVGRASIKKASGIALGITIGVTSAIAGAYIYPLTTQKITAEDRQIRSLDTALSQVRETITAPVQLAATGVPTDECLDMVDEYRDSILLTESKIKELEIDSYEMKTNPEFTTPVKRRIEKLKSYLDLSERQILLMQVQGRVPTAEELAYIMALYEPLLKGKE